MATLVFCFLFIQFHKFIFVLTILTSTVEYFPWTFYDPFIGSSQSRLLLIVREKSYKDSEDNEDFA
jgi:hypothetical protein